MNAARLIALGAPLLASAGVSPSSLSGSRTGAGTCTTSGSATATPSGGSGVFTYSWSAPGLTVTSPTSASSTFSATLSDGGSATGTATCTVTDQQNGQTATTSGVSISLVSGAGEHADISPESVHRTAAPSAGPFQDTFSIVVTGGVGPYTYSWAAVAGFGATIVGSSTGSSCVFQYSMGPDHSQLWFTTITCHVTDTGNGTTYDPAGSIDQTPT